MFLEIYKSYVIKEEHSMKYSESDIIESFHEVYGYDKDFREGQLEAIKSVLDGNRTLVVQKTGWGKSTVYFLATKLLRKAGMGPTLIFSPLISLMNDQLEKAKMFFGENASENEIRIVNSNTPDEELEDTKEKLEKNQISILFITPERLDNEKFMKDVFPKIKSIGLLVIDEAHCISDWGHDFRPDYMRIVDIVKKLPEQGSAVLATTATANNRVVKDIEKQLAPLNGEMVTLRGGLARENIYLQVIKMDDDEQKLAWLAQYIPVLRKHGLGIVYCQTIADCKFVKLWLDKYFANHDKDIKTGIYHGRLSKDERPDREKAFFNDEYDVIISTIALGMGVDKPNIGFIVHYDKPKSITEYYQQFGRAGRSPYINAYCVLLAGKNDDDTNKFFIENAFPKDNALQSVYDFVCEEGICRQYEIDGAFNCKSEELEKIIKHLRAHGAIKKTTKIHNSTNPVVCYVKGMDGWKPDRDAMDAFTKMRFDELGDINEYVNSDACLMKYVTSWLGDKNACVCKNCSNCEPKKALGTSAEDSIIKEVCEFIAGVGFDVPIRKKLPDSKNIPKYQRIGGQFYDNVNIWVLSKYGQRKNGELVRKGKYEDNYFSEELVKEASARLEPLVEQYNIKYIVPIPSLKRPDLVPNFAQRLAAKLKCKYVVAFDKKESETQKSLNNSYKQWNNINKSLSVKDDIVLDGNVLLIDDMVDSKWTLTVATIKLTEKFGEGISVFGFALAVSAGSE